MSPSTPVAIGLATLGLIFGGAIFLTLTIIGGLILLFIKIATSR